MTVRKSLEKFFVAKHNVKQFLAKLELEEEFEETYGLPLNDWDSRTEPSPGDALETILDNSNGEFVVDYDESRDGFVVTSLESRRKVLLELRGTQEEKTKKRYLISIDRKKDDTLPSLISSAEETAKKENNYTIKDFEDELEKRNIEFEEPFALLWVPW